MTVVTEISAADVEKLGTGPIPNKIYWDPNWFSAERDRVFRRVWLCVARTVDVASPGNYIVKDIGTCRASVIIARGRDGQLRAFHNVCSHRNMRVCLDKKGSTARFTCRYHGFSYDLDGQLRSVPDEEYFFGLDKGANGLTPVALETCGTFIFINLDPKPKQQLKEFLGELYDRLESFPIGDWASSFSFGGEAPLNWKCVMDNFQESYHFAFTHARTVVDRATGSANVFGHSLSFEFFGPHRVLTNWGNLDHKCAPVEQLAAEYGGGFGQSAILVGLKDSDSAAKRSPNLSSYAYSLFPNVQIVVAPSYMHLIQFIPLDAETTHWVVTMYFPKAKSAGERLSQEYTMAIAKDVITEDMSVFPHIQDGMMCGAKEFVNFHRNESLCRHLAMMIQAYTEETTRGQTEVGR